MKIKYSLLLISFSLIFAASAIAGVDLEIKLAKGTDAEKQTKAQLERLLTEHDLSKWIFTKKIIVEEGVIPHSHPVLTVSARHLKDDELLISEFVHEQIHWFVIEDQKRLKSVLDEIRVLFPDVPKKGPEGARDENSTYLHIPVVYLEMLANQEILGRLRAKQVIDYWSTHHYTWIYKTVPVRARDIGRIIYRHGLIPKPKTQVAETGR